MRKRLIVALGVGLAGCRTLLPDDDICTSEYCTDGVACATIHRVDSGAAFAAAVASARAGDCIALAAGHYGAVMLPDGVSLLGRDIDECRIDGVETGGEGVTLRGLSILKGSLRVRTGSTTTDRIRVTDSPQDGIVAAPGTLVTMRASEVRNFTRYGISAFDAASVTLESSVIEGNKQGGPGLWAQCADGCGCASSLALSLTDVMVAGTNIVGLSLVGADATLHNVEVRETALGPDLAHGGGIAVSGCSTVTATDVRIVDNADFGLMIVDSSMNVDGLKASGNLGGLLIFRIGYSRAAASVEVRNADIVANLAMGIAVSQGASNVTIASSRVADTKEGWFPVVSGRGPIAYGITWKSVSHLVLDGVSVSSSAMQGILINGGVAPDSLIANVVLEGGDEQRGILQQNFVEGTDLSPQVVNSPPLTVTAAEQLPVPAL